MIVEAIESGAVDMDEADRLMEKIKPILAGKFPPVQSFALAELLAIWLLGHDEDTREQLLQAHIETVRSLIEGRK